ncbi:hypothetical protein SRB5_21070 [Streptomyces sp. RB5]|uniref:Secreted protein n=1 Tax=Streptomyces smaragdinus TaxID=2585196 RepID=A0A7K0CET1_9ACTN|nr:hypothetical protein [Streptomyces smaragdinus]MQY11979.1 hypothetical protein [Streptomyces smaragdinus]
MRFRNTLAAAAGALALVVSLPTSAEAATGEFFYRFSGPTGEVTTRMLLDPGSFDCLTLWDVTRPLAEPAHSPLNRTDEWATVYTGLNCDGDSFTLRPHTGHASERLKMRSVRFTPFRPE